MKALLHFYRDEWYFAGPMTALAMTAFALVAWRYLLNRAADTDVDRLLADVQEALRAKGVRGALGVCREGDGLIARVLFVAGLEAADQGPAAMRRSMAHAVELDVLPRLHFLLAPIIAIAKIATMVGLLGTVISMINTFSAIGEAAAKGGGGGGVAAQAGAIGLALFATALGLMTAIPLVFTHVLFKAWIAGYEVRMKAAGLKLMALVQNARGGAGAARPVPAAVPLG